MFIERNYWSARTWITVSVLRRIKPQCTNITEHRESANASRRKYSMMLAVWSNTRNRCSWQRRPTNYSSPSTTTTISDCSCPNSTKWSIPSMRAWTCWNNTRPSIRRQWIDSVLCERGSAALSLFLARRFQGKRRLAGAHHLVSLQCHLEDRAVCQSSAATGHDADPRVEMVLERRSLHPEA